MLIIGGHRGGSAHVWVAAGGRHRGGSAHVRVAAGGRHRGESAHVWVAAGGGILLVVCLSLSLHHLPKLLAKSDDKQSLTFPRSNQKALAAILSIQLLSRR